MTQEDLERYNYGVVVEQIEWQRHDKKLLPKMLESSLESIKHKIELEAIGIAGETLTYTEKEIKDMLIQLLKVEA